MSIFDRFEVVGHRGACASAPENTIESFEHALELGATAVELDLRITKDGEIVVIHDADIERTTDRSGLVRELSLAEVKQADAGSWFSPKYAGATIPTFSEVLDVLRGRAGIVVEIKDDPVWDDPSVCEKLIELLNDYDMLKDVEIISFNHRIIEKVSSLCPEICYGILYLEPPADLVNYTRKVGASVIHPLPPRGTSLVDVVDLERIYEDGLMVLATTQDEAEMKKLITAGVHGICSDHPDLLAKAFKDTVKE
jgi:glycerophosphoryl diester phosphodiesterase